MGGVIAYQRTAAAIVATTLIVHDVQAVSGEFGHKSGVGSPAETTAAAENTKPTQSTVRTCFTEKFKGELAKVDRRKVKTEAARNTDINKKSIICRRNPMLSTPSDLGTSWKKSAVGLKRLDSIPTKETRDVDSDEYQGTDQLKAL